MKSTFLSMVTLITGLANSSPVFAQVTGKHDEIRTFTFDSTGFYHGIDGNTDSLVASGDGNISGNAKNGNIPKNWNVTVDGSGSGYDTSMFQISKLGDDSGTFSIASDAWDRYSRIAIGLKFGNNMTIDWVIYEVEKYASFGSWSTNPKQGGGLSHYMVYTMDNATPPSNVPLPGAFWLLGSGLLGLGFFGRKKQSVV